MMLSLAFWTSNRLISRPYAGLETSPKMLTFREYLLGFPRPIHGTSAAVFPGTMMLFTAAHVVTDRTRWFRAHAAPVDMSFVALVPDMVAMHIAGLDERLFKSYRLRLVTKCRAD